MALAEQTYGFYIPTVSLMGIGCAKETGAQAKALGATKLLIVTDAGLSKMGVADKIKAQVEAAGAQGGHLRRRRAEPDRHERPCRRQGLPGQQVRRHHLPRRRQLP